MSRHRKRQSFDLEGQLRQARPQPGRDFLQGLGCTYAQGYHIANPMEASAFPGWLEDWRHFF